MRYRLAEGNTDYMLAKELAEAEGFQNTTPIFPTVIALDDDNEVVGMLATVPRDDMVLAGPLVLRHDKRRVFTALQLINLYEVTMRGLGMSRVVFHAVKDSFLDKGIKKYMPYMEPYAEEGPDAFYMWPLDRNEATHGRQQ